MRLINPKDILDLGDIATLHSERYIVIADIPIVRFRSA